MARDIFVNGPTLVTVDGQSLGYTDQQIKITPTITHEDIKVDDYGEKVPPDVMYWLADVGIDMTLVHFDRSVVDYCMKFAMGGGTLGTMQGGGSIMGSAGAGNSSAYIKLQLNSTVGNVPWTFKTAYLQHSVEIPVGVERSLIRMTWRAIPWSGTTVLDIVSSGTVLFTNT